MRLDRFSLQQFFFISPINPHKPALNDEVLAPLQIDTLMLQAYTENKTLMLEQLQISAPQGQLKLQGSAAPERAV